MTMARAELVRQILGAVGILLTVVALVGGSFRPGAWVFVTILVAFLLCVVALALGPMGRTLRSDAPMRPVPTRSLRLWGGLALASAVVDVVAAATLGMSSVAFERIGLLCVVGFLAGIAGLAAAWQRAQEQQAPRA
jgi:hypothetical protein